jgi:hypothetical protein
MSRTEAVDFSVSITLRVIQRQSKKRVIPTEAVMSAFKKIIEILDAIASWVREFFSVSNLARFSFWISVIGSFALFATSESMEVLRVIVEDRKHQVRGPVLFATAALFFGLMSWYWARVLIYLIEPQLLKDPAWENPGKNWLARLWQHIRHAFSNPRRLAALWIPRLCGIIPFAGIAYSLYHAANPQGHVDQDSDTHQRLMLLFYVTIASGFLFLAALFFRRPLADYFRSKFPVFWPNKIKTTGPVGVADLPLITKGVLILTLLFSLLLFITFYTTTGQVRTAGWVGPAPLLLFTAGVWIALGSAVVVYFGRLVRLPILTPLLILALLFSYFDLNDNHKIRDYNDNRLARGEQPVRRVPADFNQQFNSWLQGRKDRDEFKGRPYPVFIVTAEGGGITTAYYTALVLSAIQDRNPAFAQHVFAISGVSGGSVGTAVYAGLNAKCQPAQVATLPTEAPWKDNAGPWQTSADKILMDDYLSPVLAAALYPDLVQRFLPFPMDSWDRARALEERLELSWIKQASCAGENPTGSSELSQPYYDFWKDFPNGAVPAVYFNTTSVERGERMLVTNLSSGSDDKLFANFETLAQMNDRVDPPFSTATFLSARFPVISPAGYIMADGHKFRYVDGGYYENSGTDTANDILLALNLNHKQYDPPIMPIIIRIGFPLPAPRMARQEEQATTVQPSEERTKYKGEGLGEILSPVKTLLNTRGARGADSVRQIQNTIDELNLLRSAEKNGATTTTSAGSANGAQSAAIIAFEIAEEKVALPLGWLLSDRSRCDMQQQMSSIVIGEDCKPGNETVAKINREKIQQIVGMLLKAQ